MTAKDFGNPLAKCVLGCLLIGLSDGLTSWSAAFGYLFLALALFDVVIRFTRGQDAPAEVDLSASEKDSLRAELATKGFGHTARHLRRAHPGLTLVQAKQILDAL